MRGKAGHAEHHFIRSGTTKLVVTLTGRYDPFNHVRTVAVHWSPANMLFGRDTVM